MLERILSMRQRTVSRGFIASRGLSDPWDSAELSEVRQQKRTTAGGSRGILRSADSPSTHLRGSGAAVGAGRNTTKGDRERFESEDRAFFGTSRRWEGVDKGFGSAVGSGDAVTKALDPISRKLVEAPDRAAFGGVAAFPSGRRRPRDGGSRKIMQGTLDMIDVQNRQTAKERVQQSWGRSR